MTEGEARENKLICSRITMVVATTHGKCLHAIGYDSPSLNNTIGNVFFLLIEFVLLSQTVQRIIPLVVAAVPFLYCW